MLISWFWKPEDLLFFFLGGGGVEVVDLKVVWFYGLGVTSFVSFLELVYTPGVVFFFGGAKRKAGTIAVWGSVKQETVKCLRYQGNLP